MGRIVPDEAREVRKPAAPGANGAAPAPQIPKPQTPVRKAELPEAEDLFNGVKLAPPRSFFRRVNRAYAWATKSISQDEFETLCETVRKHLDGREMHPEDAATWSQKVISAMADGLNVATSVASCDKSDICILVAYGGRPRQGMFYSRSFRLRDPRGLKRIG